MPFQNSAELPAKPSEATATTLVSNAIAGGNVQAINYFVANNYVKALESLAKAPNQKVIMMPLEASSLIGTLGGIGAIAKEVFGDGGGTPPARPAVPRAPRTPPAPPAE